MKNSTKIRTVWHEPALTPKLLIQKITNYSLINASFHRIDAITESRTFAVIYFFLLGKYEEKPDLTDFGFSLLESLLAEEYAKTANPYQEIDSIFIGIATIRLVEKGFFESDLMELLANLNKKIFYYTDEQALKNCSIINLTAAAFYLLLFLEHNNATLDDWNRAVILEHALILLELLSKIASNLKRAELACYFKTVLKLPRTPLYDTFSAETIRCLLPLLHNIAANSAELSSSEDLLVISVLAEYFYRDSKSPFTSAFTDHLKKVKPAVLEKLTDNEILLYALLNKQLFNQTKKKIFSENYNSAYRQIALLSTGMLNNPNERSTSKLQRYALLLLDKQIDTLEILSDCIYFLQLK